MEIKTPADKKMMSFLYFYRLLHLFVFFACSFFLFILTFCSKRLKQGFANYLGYVKSFEHKKSYLIHAVSMGESQVAIALCKRLRTFFPDYKVAFSTTHPDVYNLAAKTGLFASVSFFPLDNYFFVKRALTKWNPSFVLVAETDFWPEIAYQCRQKNIPLYLINGRISEKICWFYSIFKGFSYLVFDSFKKLWVQTELDKERLIKMGVKPHKISVVGNIKADLLSDSLVAEIHTLKNWKNEKKLVVFGSMHPSEFCNCLTVFKKLIESKILVIIAPRNISNAATWRNVLVKNGINTKLRTDANYENAETLILNSMGELSSVYAIADLAFIGGTFDKKVGGHNPLEIIQKGVPLLSGPCYRNFEEIVSQLKSEKAIKICNNESELLKEMLNMFANIEQLKNQVLNAEKVLKMNSGALDKTVQALYCDLKVTE